MKIFNPYIFGLYNFQPLHFRPLQFSASTFSGPTFSASTFSVPTFSGPTFSASTFSVPMMDGLGWKSILWIIGGSNTLYLLRLFNFVPSKMMDTMIRLTQYSHGAGCGCKISPQVLSQILHSNVAAPDDANLLVGNNTRDDAAVYDLGNGTALISTTDFFMPIVDDPYDFGRIASANAISDVFAMGGKPILAIAILGWPIDKLSAEVAQKVIEGSRSICAEAGIALAGGHSIDSPEPIFGLAVNGLVAVENIKTNSGAKPGDLLFLTKPIGIGIYTTAIKKGLLKPEHIGLAEKWMTTLNTIGTELALISGVHAMTDVTGFGLMGHLTEMCEGSGVQAELDFNALPLLPGLEEYINLGSTPGGTTRNFASYGHHLDALTDMEKAITCDPQTSGGLLIAASENSRAEIEKLFKSHGINDLATPIGMLKNLKDEFLISLH